MRIYTTTKARVTRDIFAHNIAIKKIWRHLTISSNKFPLTNQGKLFKNLVNLVLCFDKSLP